MVWQNRLYRSVQLKMVSLLIWIAKCFEHYVKLANLWQNTKSIIRRSEVLQQILIDEYKRCASWTHWIINYWSKTNPISKKQAEWAVVLSLTRAVWALLTIIGWNSSSISAYTNTRKHCQTTLFFNTIMLNYYNQIQCYAVIKLLNQKMTLLYHIQQAWQTFHIWKHTHTHNVANIVWY